MTLSNANLIDGRIVFHRKKTHKLYSIAIPECAKTWLDDFRQEITPYNPTYPLTFINPSDTPLEQMRKVVLVISNAIDNIRRVAKKCGIDKPVTTYNALYAGANIARKNAR